MFFQGVLPGLNASIKSNIGKNTICVGLSFRGFTSHFLPPPGTKDCPLYIEAFFVGGGKSCLKKINCVGLAAFNGLTSCPTKNASIEAFSVGER